VGPWEARGAAATSVDDAAVAFGRRRKPPPPPSGAGAGAGAGAAASVALPALAAAGLPAGLTKEERRTVRSRVPAAIQESHWSAC